MAQQEIIMDRTFDAACLMLNGEPDWSEQILIRLKANNEKYTDYITEVYNFYITVGTNNPDFVKHRAEYMLNNKGKLKLRFK